jgi:transposase InsO family protein
MVENEMDSKIKCLRSDNGGEFTLKEFMDYCNKHGIKRQFFVARTPQQNGFVERKNKTIQEMDQTMLMDSKLTDFFGHMKCIQQSHSKQSNAQKQQ